MTIGRRWLLRVLGAWGTAFMTGITLPAAEPANPRQQAAAAIEQALRDDRTGEDAVQRSQRLDQVAKQVVDAVPANVAVASMLAGVRERASDGNRDARRIAEDWREALSAAREMLLFEPLMEAPLPEGFPDPVPVGEVRLQRFPAYRLARTPMGFLEGRAFWTLFNHIKEREIAMTAPVEMTYAEDGGKAKATAMSFLYRSTAQGQAGKAGSVDVVDIDTHVAVSMGLRGEPNRKRVEEARVHLDRWLSEHSGEFEAAGPLRVMGYNSPFVPDNRKYTEVQIPLRTRAGGDLSASSGG